MDSHPKRKTLENLRSSFLRTGDFIGQTNSTHPPPPPQSEHNTHISILLNIFLKHYFLALPLFPLSVYTSHTSLMGFLPNLPSFLPLAILNTSELKRNNVIPIHKNLIRPHNKLHLLYRIAGALGFTGNCGILTQ